MSKTKAATKPEDNSASIADKAKEIREQADKQVQALYLLHLNSMNTKILELTALYEELPAEMKEDFWRTRKPMIRNLGLNFGASGSGVKAPRGPRAPKVTDEEILKFLATKKTSKEVQDGLKLSVNTGKRLNALYDTGKLHMDKDGTTKYWLAKKAA